MAPSPTTSDAVSPSLAQLMSPEVLADPYPLYERMRTESPVLWDPYIHAWVVTRYDDVQHVIRHFSAARMPTPERLAQLGMDRLTPIAELTVRQMLFLDAPDHRRIRNLAAAAFTPRRIAQLHDHVSQVTRGLVAELAGRASFDVMSELANPLPGIITAELLGVPTEDRLALRRWAEDFGELLGNFQHNPGRAAKMLGSLAEMVDYFGDRVRAELASPGAGLIHAVVSANVDGDRFSEQEMVANLCLLMVAGLETTTHLIGNGLLSLLRHPDQERQLRADPELMAPAVEELLRFEAPTQFVGRIAPADAVINGQAIEAGTAVVAVIAAANRDPAHFIDPDRLDLARTGGRHVSFGWSAHFCLGAPLARMEGAIALAALLENFPELRLDPDKPARWRPNLSLRGLETLPVLTGP